MANVNIIANNLMAMNSQRMLGLNTTAKARSIQKLSSGYRINRAADDAAGLAISEKMRRQIRGLNQGTKNAQDGISWVQTGDGSLDTVHEILNRMTELTVKSLNETNSDSDRAAMQLEFDQLQSEIDHIAGNAVFNEKNIFSPHQSPYYQIEGNIVWLQGQRHVISNGSNDLSIVYRQSEGSSPQTAGITVPVGEYTTQELIDEIDTALENAGLKDKGICFEFTEKGTCNVNMEGGVKIDNVGGALSYLLHDVYKGGSLGALIGTTQFPDERDTIAIVYGQNDELEFTIESLNGSTSTKKLRVPTGSSGQQRYTRSQLIDWLNLELKGTTVTAEAYGSGIRLFSDDSLVTRFKGNMFKVENKDKGEEVFTSVFYDNVGYGTVIMTHGSFTGGSVMPLNYKDAEHQFFHITPANQELQFSPDPSGAPVAVTIPEGDYTMSQMVSKLNELFKEKDLDLNATIYDDGSFQGLQLTTNTKGLDSKIGIDPSSSAYDTLFVTRAYNNYKNDAVIDRETVADRDVSYTGGKTFNTANTPLIIGPGNDRFYLTINNSVPKEISLQPGIYQTAAEIANAINNSLPADCGVRATPKNDHIGFVEQSSPLPSPRITSIAVSPVNGNNGYDDIFIKEISYRSVPASGWGSATLNTAIPDPVALDGNNNKLTVSLNNKDYTINLPTGNNVTHDDIIAAIDKELTPKTITNPNIFSDVTAQGRDISFSENGTGSSKVNEASYQNTGSDDQLQGSAGGYLNNTPAKITIDAPLPSSTVITDKNNQFQCTINGTQKSITLDNGSYTPDQFASMLQQKLDNEFGNHFGGVDVTLDNNQLVLTARLTMEDGYVQPGGFTNISCDTATSSFLKELHTVKTPATITLDKDLLSSISIENGKNVFTFNYTKDGVSTPISLNLRPGQYSSSSLVSEINTQLSNGNYGVTARLNGSRLQLSTTGSGSEYGLSYDTAGNTDSSISMFGAGSTPASATVDLAIQQPITIDENSRDFNIVVNNTTVSVKLPTGRYNTRADFVNALNTSLQSAGITASLDGSRIRYTTTATGESASFSVTYANGGSAMKAIYGETKTTLPGATASFTPDGKLQLNATGSGVRISVSPGNGNIFQTTERVESRRSPSSLTGYHSTKCASVDGVDNIPSPLEIDRWNRNLSFSFYDNGTYRGITISLDPGSYTYSQLQSALQAKLNAAGYNGKLNVTVGSAGVQIHSSQPGSRYHMSNFSGSFWDKVMNTCVEEKVDTNPKPPKDGTQDTDPAYSVGRKDILHNNTEITAGVNDTLTLDFTYGGTPHPLSIHLQPGNYDGPGLVSMVQDGLNTELEKMGLEKNTIKVSIGGINTGVEGSNDDNALTFQLSRDVKLPGEGQYIIDGVGGKAAYSIFYQTDGEIRVAYITGSKDVSQGITLPADETELSFRVDGTDYHLQLDEGTYSPDELTAHLNAKLQKEGAPVSAEIYDGKLRLSSTRYGKHDISNISGESKQHLFFQENGALEGEDEIPIQLSSKVDDYVTIERPTVNTSFLGINSIAITRPKYARKALEHLKKATELVSNVRSMFGSKQNRLGYAIRNNENISENTQAAESLIRDANMSKEAMNLARTNILEQAGTAILAQARMAPQEVLHLLR